MAGERRSLSGEEPLVVERYYDRGLTGRGRAGTLVAEAFATILRLMALALLLAPFVMLGVLTIDLPLFAFDWLSGLFGLTASNYLSRGEGLFMLVLFAGLLMTRRWGPGRAARAIGTAWLLAVGFVAMVVLDLSQDLTQADFPPTRFLVAMILSWPLAQMLAAQAYQLTRGGAWWRAPFFGGAVGLLGQALIYFPAAYAGTAEPWGWWMITQVLLSLILSAAFLPVYGLFRRLIRPRAGLGGR